MSAVAGERLTYRGWRFLIPDSARPKIPPGSREALLEAVVQTVQGGRGAPMRRSRHATTWLVTAGRAGGEHPGLFVKQLDALRGLSGRLKRLLRKRRSEHVARITEQLRRDGFGAPQVLVAGYHRASGREVIATERLDGSAVSKLVNPRFAADRATRRAVLRALGAEIGRLHGTGYVHGDLTPYNVFVVSREPIRFAFIDHERTRRLSPLSPLRSRGKMRNLVQLGRFEFARLTRIDRMRFFLSYVRTAKVAPRRTLGAITRMIAKRRRREGAAPDRGPRRAPVVRQREAGES